MMNRILKSSIRGILIGEKNKNQIKKIRNRKFSLIQNQEKLLRTMTTI